MTDQQTGRCHCGAVHYRISGAVKGVVNCHCNSCRQRSGAAYSTYCVVAEGDFQVVQGEEQLSAYQVTELSRKHFCAACGTPLYNTSDRYPGLRMAYYGTLTDHAALVPVVNIYCESKLAWVDGVVGLKSYDRSRAG